MINAADEQAHAPGEETLWNESWYFDFAAPDGSLGGYVRLGLYPGLGACWYWAYLCGEGRPLVAVRDHAVGMPAAPSLEVRADGLWSSLTCETPLEHWTIGLEAFAVAMDDPGDAYRGERGERVAFGLDLEWERAGPVYEYPGMSRYEQACDVHGEVLVGNERIAFEGPGERDHSWGVRDWWAFPWCWTSGRLDDGTAFHAARPLIEGVTYAPGFVLPAGGELAAIDGFDVATELGADDLPARASMKLGPLALTVTPAAHTTMLLEAPDGRVSRFPRSLCRFVERDGRAGVGWTEWLQPPPP